MAKKVFSLCFIALLLSTTLLIPVNSLNERKISVVMSKRMAPYESLATEIQRELINYDVSIETLEESKTYFDSEFIITIGQDAYKTILPIKGNSKLIYTMVLNAEEKEQNPEILGVAMIPSPRQQLTLLKNGAGIKSVSIFYNHLKSKKIAEDFSKLASTDFTYNFIDVLSEKDFLNFLETSFPKTDAILLIPDSTVLTEQGIKKLVLKSYENKVPVIGFSPMYIDLGAAISISVSEKLTAKVVANIIKQSPAQYWDRTDGLCYPRLCEIRFSKNAKEKFSLNLNKSALLCEGCEILGIE
ncbi:MAG: hypothetical protein N2445_08180 [Acidobacteria bacterium]|nr:hypothetical protein [Acidobacteriota bacterium]